MSDELLIDEVTEYLAKKIGVPGRRLGLTTCIRNDLGIDGDEALCLVEGFAERFNIDMTGFDWRLYFGAEAPFTPWGLMILCVAFVCEKPRPTYVPIKVGHLVQVAKLGHWQAPQDAAV